MSFQDKYLKYKKKYTELKNTLGGGRLDELRPPIIHDDSILIPEEIISFDDKRPYHTIPMYKKLISLCIPLITRIISLKSDNELASAVKDRSIKNITGSFPKITEVKNYTSCSKSFNGFITFDDNAKYEIIYSTNNCFMNGCDNTNTSIIVVKKNKTLLICFSTGAISPEITIGELVNKRRLLVFLSSISDEILNCKQIVLCGHSNGMAAATTLAFIMNAIYDRDFRERNKEELVTIWSLFESVEERYASLKDKSIFVMGTGGFPIFTKQEVFIDFYNSIKGRYVHILSALDIKIDDKYVKFIDRYGSRFISEGYEIIDTNRYNMKFGIYYTNYETIMHDESNIKYHGENCFSDIIILEPVDFGDWIIIDEDNQIYRNTITGEERDSFPGEIYYLESNQGFNFMDYDDYRLVDAIAEIKKSDVSPEFFSGLTALVHEFTTYRNLLSIYFLS